LPGLPPNTPASMILFRMLCATTHMFRPSPPSNECSPSTPLEKQSTGDSPPSATCVSSRPCFHSCDTSIMPLRTSMRSCPSLPNFGSGTHCGQNFMLVTISLCLTTLRSAFPSRRSGPHVEPWKSAAPRLDRQCDALSASRRRRRRPATRKIEPTRGVLLAASLVLSAVNPTTAHQGNRGRSIPSLRDDIGISV
jgi:hypothetical protein